MPVPQLLASVFLAEGVGRGRQNEAGSVEGTHPPTCLHAPHPQPKLIFLGVGVSP